MHYLKLLTTYLSILILFIQLGKTAHVGGPLIQFATFDTNNKSYSLKYHQDWSDFDTTSCGGSPQFLYSGIMNTCQTHGAINQTIEPTSSTNQLLVVTERYECGFNFVYTSLVDGEDGMQKCMQGVQAASLRREEFSSSLSRPGNGSWAQRTLGWRRG